MATMDMPTMKIERVPSPGIKAEASEDGMSPYPEDDEIYEETGDLDFAGAQQNVWLSHVPRSLWEALSSLNDDDEIEIGTIRVEDSKDTNSRVSLKFSSSIPQLRNHPKEYNLQRSIRGVGKAKRGGQTYIFSEKDTPGYKARSFTWNDPDDDGNPGQGRSYLYERNKRDQKKKEARKHFEPYSKRSIPKQTTIQGTVASEFECVPIKNPEYFELEARQSSSMLKVPEKQQATLVQGRYEPKTSHMYLTMAEKANINRQNLLRKQAAKDNRAARVERNVLIDKLLELFKLHRIWALRDLKARVNQPEAYLREILNEIGFMWKSGDFTGKWELKEEYKDKDLQLKSAETVAPEAEDTDMDRSGLDNDDDDEAFEDV